MAPGGTRVPAKPAKQSAAARLASIAAGLNERQTAYLLALYDIDQERADANRGFGTAPAATWRWIEYGPDGNRKDLWDGPLRAALARLQLVDAGAGATLSVLEGHGLLEREHRATGYAVARWDRSIQSLFVRMTATGRKVARLLRGEPATAARTPGEKPLTLTALRLLSYGQDHPDDEFHWQAPWEGTYWAPDYRITLSICKGLVNRGLLTGRPPYSLRITPAGQLLDVQAQPNWKPPKAPDALGGGDRHGGAPESAA